MGKRAPEEDVGESGQYFEKKQVGLEMFGRAPARPEDLLSLYQALEKRWRTNPPFLHRTLSYNLAPELPPPSVSITPPLQTAHQRPSPHLNAPQLNGAGNSHVNANSPARGANGAGPSEGHASHCNGLNGVSHPEQQSTLWELEVTASVWNAPKNPPPQARVGARLSAGGGVMRLPIFVGFSPNPRSQGDSFRVFPLDSMLSGCVPVVQSGEAAKLLLKLPGPAGRTPQGKILCIVWDDPDDVRRAEKRPLPGHDAVSPEQGVPLGGTAVWCEATLPAKEGTPSSAMPVLRRSNMVCNTNDDDFGTHCVHVQMTANGVIPATLRLKLCLRKSTVPADTPAVRNGHTNGHPNGAPTTPPLHPPSPSPRQPEKQVAFVLQSDSADLRPIPEFLLGWRCGVCRRYSRTYEALQLHLLGVHGRFDFFFKHVGGQPAILVRPSEAAASPSRGASRLASLDPGAEFVYWKRDWRSRRDAFYTQLRRQATKRRAQQQTRPDTAPPRQSEEIGDEEERRAKRQRSSPLEPEALRAGSNTEGPTGAATTMPGPSKEKHGPGGMNLNDTTVERPTEKGVCGHGETAEGRVQDAGEERAHCMEAARPPDTPPPQAELADPCQSEGQDLPPAVDANEQNEGGEARAWQHLGESLELQRCGSEPAPVGRSASVGPASSAGDSGAALLPWTMRSGERGTAGGAAGGSGRGDTKLAVAKKKGGSKARRKPMDHDRNMESLTKRTFYHSRTGMPMDLDDVLSGLDSEDDLDEDELQHDDKQMLDDFSDVSTEEKFLMHQWNCFARQQRIAADAHMPWASRAFAAVHKGTIGGDPGLRRVFMLMLVKFWNCALISAEDVDDCLKVVDSACEG
ncbi:VEFS-Box of polycomb protein [Klebsormidium nitens]|uniref:VEFS-Box of polycomb protein n=1 Tax=Klebsormidium nitens TaxID=105231 RepID=A0A1Y1HSL2_KLENI|nr:VEFS-Box of polycomb protein [Klebsormidium nitens]|eukprot:GAQ81615.1 VEFS-Box of polycomb protein [Klebsormidium nitens]